MELEQRNEDVKETQPCTNGTTEIKRPNKLHFKKPHFNWLRHNNQLAPEYVYLYDFFYLFIVLYMSRFLIT